ncbi:hypothetical protein THAR02_00633 [Trichoderma harzianum]|uniref:Uncharacterized protein n=1 Tax=Trichoderma harzianum TaxID=5544 RepID=A0A0G0AS39_TRIHA|nr:hypothetical protein THAR02_00633 [Trichoderma harzianum]
MLNSRTRIEASELRFIILKSHALAVRHSSAIAYYDSIQNESSYQAAASSRQAQSFEALQSSAHEETAAYHWGADHLFALRAICKPPNAVLPLLQSEISRVKAVKDEWHDIINELIQGPGESNATLGQMWEGEILRSYQNSVIGHIGTVSDGLLSQVVGVALAMRDSGVSVSAENVIVIVAIKHHIKFFHLMITDTFHRRFKTLSPRDETADLGSFLPVESTEWLDGAIMDGRQSIAHHVMALVRWAKKIAMKESDDKVGNQDELTETSL